MAPHCLFYQLLLVALIVLCLLMHVCWPDKPAAASQLSLEPNKRHRKRSKESKPFTGLIHQPLCEACKQGTDPRPKAALGSPPPIMTFSRGRRHTVDTHAYCWALSQICV